MDISAIHIHIPSDLKTMAINSHLGKNIEDGWIIYRDSDNAFRTIMTNESDDSALDTSAMVFSLEFFKPGESTPVLTLTEADGDITNDDAGIIDYSLSQADILASLPRDRYLFVIKYTISGGDQKPLAQGYTNITRATNPGSTTTSVNLPVNVAGVTVNMAVTIGGVTSQSVITALGYTPANSAGLASHIADVANPHGVTKSQVGLSAVDNTADVDKPVSTAQKALINKTNFSNPLAKKVPLTFDDGYLNNYTTAVPLLERYGMRATFCIEVENINRTNTPLAHMTAAHLRELADKGHELAIHFAADTYLSSTDQEIYNAAKADIDLLIDVLTGYKTIAPLTGVVTTIGSDEFPQYRELIVKSCSYRGGVRNIKVDRVLKAIFQSIRGIPSDSNSNFTKTLREDGESTSLISGESIDTSGTTIDRVLAKVRGCASGFNKPCFYLHSVPPDGTDQSTHASSSILESEFEVLVKTAYENNIQFTTIGAVNSGNIFGGNEWIDDAPFTKSEVGTGNTVTLDTTVKYLTHLPFSIKLDAVTAVESNNFFYRLGTFYVEPFTRYHIEVIYKIDIELAGRGGANEGLQLVLETSQGTGTGLQVSSDILNEQILNSNHPLNVRGLPYQATGGQWKSLRTVLHTGNGSLAQLSVGLRSVTGTVWIGFFIVEKGDSLAKVPLGGKSTFNTTVGRRIVLPSLRIPADTLSGTVSITAGTAALTGVGTKFTELFEGDLLKIGTQYIRISSIASDTSLTLESNHSAGASGSAFYKVNDNGRCAGWKVDFLPDNISDTSAPKVAYVQEFAGDKFLGGRLKVYDESTDRSSTFRWTATPFDYIP